jgi:hypothetical protein
MDSTTQLSRLARHQLAGSGQRLKVVVLCLLVVLLGAYGAFQAARSAPFATASAAPLTEARIDDRSSPVALIISYYNAINRKEFGRAYGYWENPPNGASLTQFARGFADTAHDELSLRPPGRIEGAAASRYARVPTVVIATHTDGGKRTFFGPPREDMGWRIYSASVKVAPAGADKRILLDAACRP